jgi:CubicO group peptidase (beta-lactamase class C family)
LDDGWQVATLSQAGMKAAPIAELIGKIRGGGYRNIHAVLVARGGRLIIEAYFDDHDRDKPHPLRSATKSIGSVLIGIAIDRGYLRNADETIWPYFENHISGRDERSKAVTVKSLLTMTSGFDCDDHRGEPFECEKAMYRTDDWLHFALNLPMTHHPGQYWAYNSTSLILLSEIITQCTGLSVPLFADKYLMKPLGITGFRWGYSPKGRAWLGGNATMRPRDMLKFGQMCLNEGVWQNRRIVSDAWLSESTRCHVLSEYGMEYGYLWWRGRQTISGRHIEAFWAQGNGGQVIFVCPEMDTVAAFTGGNYNSMLEFQFMGMLVDHIFPSMLPSGPEETFIAPDTQAMSELPGAYRCNPLHLDLFAEEDGLAGRLEGHKFPLILKGNDRFSIDSPIFGSACGRILRDDHGQPTALLINIAFSELCFKKSE